jgi:hypothetical protein
VAPESWDGLTVKPEALAMTQHKFRVKLLGQAGSEGAALKPPFDVVAVFQRKGRVPVRGTIDGFPFRSSLMNMGDGHMMVVNAQLRAGAQCKAGDTVTVLMELDEDKRTVEVPAHLKKIIDRDPKAREFWPKLSFTHQKEYVKAIEDAKKPETREKRIAAMMDALRKGQRKK